MANPQTVIDWKAFTDTTLNHSDIRVLLAISFLQGRTNCAITTQAYLAQICNMRRQHIGRSIKKLSAAGHISVTKIPNSRRKSYKAAAVTTRNNRLYWLEQDRESERSRRAELTLVEPIKTASS